MQCPSALPNGVPRIMPDEAMGRGTFTKFPDHFEGTIGELIEAFVVPNWPTSEAMMTWADSLMSYFVDSPDPVFILRGKGRGALNLVNQSRVVHSDNAPGIWCYLRCADGSVSPSNLADVLTTGRIPVAMIRTSAEREAWTYGRTMTTFEQSIWSKGLKHCHILPVRKGSLSLKARALRNLCPMNHFLFATPSQYAMRRLGWSEPRPVADLGESESVISVVQQRLTEHLCIEGREVYDRYLSGVGAPPQLQSSPELRVLLTRRSAQTAASPRPVVDSSPLHSQVAQSSRRFAKRRWALNERHGFYLATGITDEFISLTLQFRRLAGEIERIGEFALNMKELAAVGAVTQRVTPDATVYDIRIEREALGTFSIVGPGEVRRALN
jgi:hypothetical protein